MENASGSTDNVKSMRCDRYVLVQWIEDDSYTVQNESCVINDKMMNDNSLTGLVKWINEGKEPKGGWSKHAAKILASGGKVTLYFPRLY